MSKIADRIGSRYDAIIEHFIRRPFGTHPPDMTVLSLLPPEDRCIILERLFQRHSGNILDLVDKLSMAYLKAEWPDLANRFVEACVKGGWIIPEHGAFFLNKLDTLMVHGVFGRLCRHAPQSAAVRSLRPGAQRPDPHALRDLFRPRASRRHLAHPSRRCCRS